MSVYGVEILLRRGFPLCIVLAPILGLVGGVGVSGWQSHL